MDMPFKGWDRINQRLFDIASLNSRDEGAVCIYPKPTEHERFVFGLTLGKECDIVAFTGLRDLNRQPIYEEDIVEYIDGEYSFKGVVKKDAYLFYIQGIEPIDNFSFDDIVDASTNIADVRVIGHMSKDVKY